MRSAHCRISGKSLSFKVRKKGREAGVSESEVVSEREREGR